jgi:hypothetical protein
MPKRDKINVRGIVGDTTFNGKTDTFTASNVPRQCPLVLLAKVI